MQRMKKAGKKMINFNEKKGFICDRNDVNPDYVVMGEGRADAKRFVATVQEG